MSMGLPSQKKIHHLYIWQSNLVFTLITHRSPFLSDTHFLNCDYWFLDLDNVFFNLWKGKSQS